MTVSNLHPMTLAEALSVLAGIGYREDWTIDQLRAATPADMRSIVAAALRITAAAAHAEANRIEHG